VRIIRFADAGLRSPNAVVALAITAALLVLGACAALLFYAEAAVDQLSEARESRLMRVAIADQLGDIREDVVANGAWTDAYLHATSDHDPAWFQLNLGSYLFPVRKHNVTVVFDEHDQPFYVAMNGRRATPSAAAAFIEAARPLATAARARSAAKIARNPNAIALERQGSAAAAIRTGTRVFIASAATIVPETDYGPPKPGEPAILISARLVDAKLLSSVGEDFGLSHLRLALDHAARTSAPLPGADGRAVAAVAWEPAKPGVGVLLRARWQILAIGLAVASVVTLLVLRLRRLTRSVADARDRALAGDHAKSEFIANMSHEIRTPLNGVLGMAQVMDTHELSAEQRERLRVIRESGATLLALLNDVLDLSKIEAGRLEIVETTFSLDELVQRVTATFEGVAAAKDLALNAEIAPAARGPWTGDALRIRQVLSNLVSNAVKFTETGHVTLAVAPEGEGLRFSVTDTGIGLDPAKIPQLFDKFSQADASTTRRYGGTGLGLAIVHALVGLMDGVIAVESRPGEGARFSVVLPLQRAAGAAPEALEPGESARPSAALRVLAAEDNLINQHVLRALLEPLDAEVTLVANGREAVEAFVGGAFDVVLMDVQMPQMNGVDATRAIRAIEAETGRPPTPILALTANVMSHQLEGYAAAGMDGHIAKPLDVSDLYAALEGALNRPGQAAAA
jgi:signal transduction histidine kinase/ActR/RegA family two-component response regulator